MEPTFSKRTKKNLALVLVSYLALMATKQILQDQFDWSSEDMWDRQGAICGPVFASEDAREGSAAFKEEREPAWKGR